MFVAKMKAAMAIVLTVSIVGVGGGFGYRSIAAQDEGGGATTPVGGATETGDDVSPEAKKLLKTVEDLKRQLEETQDRAEALKAKLAHVQDQLGLKRTNPPGKTATLPGVGATTTDFHAADERDRIELLQARVATKEADLKASLAMLEEANLRFQGAEKAGRTIKGSISRDDLAAAKVTVDRYRAEVEAKKMDLLEAKILLRQAERRLTATTSSTTTSKSLEQRVAELEQQVAEMRKTMPRTLRNEDMKRK